jgi:hypothetical protein
MVRSVGATTHIGASVHDPKDSINSYAEELDITTEPTSKHGERDPESAACFNDAQTRFVESVRGGQIIRDGADIRRDGESERDETDLQRLESFT